MAATNVSTSGPLPMIHTAPLTTRCQINAAANTPQKRLLVWRLTKGVIAKTKSNTAKMNGLTGSKNKFVKATIVTGSKCWIRRSSVSLGMNKANASKGEKFAGKPINLLAAISAINIARFFNILTP